MMQVSKKIPFDNPDVLVGVRALYLVSNVIILGLYLYVRTQINQKKGTCPLPFPFSSFSHGIVFYSLPISDLFPLKQI
jgi:Phosphate transport (Pho88)